MMNIHAALRMRLRGSPCKCFGPDLAMRTVGEKIRFPDALVTCTRFPGTDRIAPNPVVVFEVLTPTSGPMDRVTKVEEYRAVPSIRRYVIVESAVRRVLVLNRAPGVESWTEMPLAADETLDLPEIGCGIQVEELYENVLFAEAASTP
jgi:Uma2 family endonuclease